MSTKRPISEQYIYSEKEGWGQQTCDQPEGIKPINSFPIFQNGEFTVAENSFGKKNEYFLRTTERVMFRWKGTLHQFLYLCFGLAPAPYVFTKLLKIPMTFLRRIGICIVIYLDDMLIIGRTREETIALRDTVILLPQCL